LLYITIHGNIKIEKKEIHQTCNAPIGNQSGSAKEAVKGAHVLEPSEEGMFSV
jgi:hypothetical protein